MKILILSIIAYGAYIILDLVWFRFVGPIFKGEIEPIARLTESGAWDVALLPAALVYVAMTIGLLVFVFPKSVTLGTALVFGALFGFVTYAIFDMTNVAILKDWTWKFVVVDVLWGTALNAAVAALVYLLATRID